MRCRSHGGLWHLGLEVLFRPPRPLFASACLASCVRCIRQDAGAQPRGEPLEQPHPGPVALVGECCEGHGDRRSPHGAPQPVAKSLRGATHRLGATRVPKPYCRSRRTASATHPDRVLRVLSPSPHSPLARQGCTRRTADRAAGARRDHPDSRSRWPASSLRPPGGVVPTPHRPVFTDTNAHHPVLSFPLAAGPPESLRPRPAARDDCNRVPYPISSCSAPLRGARMSAERAVRSFGEGQVWSSRTTSLVRRRRKESVEVGTESIN